MDVQTSVGNKNYKTGKWPATWAKSLVTTLLQKKKRTAAVSKKPRTSSLISNPSRLMMNIISTRTYRFQSQVEGNIVEGQSGFRAERRTSNQITYRFVDCSVAFTHLVQAIALSLLAHILMNDGFSWGCGASTAANSVEMAPAIHLHIIIISSYNIWWLYFRLLYINAN